MICLQNKVHQQSFRLWFLYSPADFKLSDTGWTLNDIFHNFEILPKKTHTRLLFKIIFKKMKTQLILIHMQL